MSKKKLSLHREILRSLNPETLREVAGGNNQMPTQQSCPSMRCPTAHQCRPVTQE